MGVLVSVFGKILGVKLLIEYSWRIIKPKAIEWAKDDGKEDWDDEAVRVLDELIQKVVKNL